MLTAYTSDNNSLKKIDVNRYSDLTPDMVWLDLANPTEQERQWIKQAYSQELQFMEELGEIQADVDSLINHSNFLAERTKFLMDAAMGAMNIVFNRRLNIFTVLSVILMPPMLVASIYGMNFAHMPELDWLWGYPMALVLMVISAIGPFVYLKHKGWL